MRTQRLFVAPALLLGVSMAVSTAQAVELPKRKPGLWEVTMQMTAGMPPMVMKLCTDAATDTEAFKMGLGAGQEMCTRKDMQQNGNVFTMESECKFGETKATSHAVMTFTGDSAYKTVIQSRYDPPMHGRTDSTMTQDAKWASACPADMKPGDMIGPNGMKMNMMPAGK